ncbi:hypothetical protein [Acetonema longum]|uniref:Uncharacterized protein n=1 Tax=Acetonema longum DSM 6540 TaxID=1009370 RepID=F7NK05_9FIRM|nr:hypothetical protein [Acetonema longum]EGO63652.1 hypothetical protein ALO_12084 [Acetonema longum DSM 6540]
MLTIDFIALLLTACLVGFRYPLYVCFAVIIHELGRLIVTVFFHGQIEAMVVAGVFSTSVVNNMTHGLKGLLIALSGPLANYLASGIAGGSEWEKTADLVNPVSSLKYPFAVIHLRFAVLSLAVSLWSFFF